MTNDYTNIVDMDLYKQARAINEALTKVHAQSSDVWEIVKSIQSLQQLDTPLESLVVPVKLIQ